MEKDDDRNKFGGDEFEEYAAEITAPLTEQHNGRRDESHESRSAGAGLQSRKIGYTALFIALAALFVWPAILGPIAVVLGFIAFRGGSKSLGTWSISIGLVTFIAYFLLLPYFP
ncbi:DUF4190 domain-containing protein [Paenibacillus eucommiae]|uniref:DUF4190 domain-containing protein n=1 Tax=Paenibacillus eucommiae TaxID=1355755 RepID=A0ABS4J0H6_9BACL|nr:DUF4190 domain-containing protein [Paenibacillus eucommiae]MBP1992830.1 hypothetical protein [Paenibacillus eucommiae]